MPNYADGKIYTIRCKRNDTLIYVGSTTQALSVRFGGHKRGDSTSLSHYIYNPENNTRWAEWYIELYELCPCNNRMELCKREYEVIREIATINRVGYTLQNVYHCGKKVDYEDIAEKKKEEREKKKLEIAEANRLFCEKNRDYIIIQ